MKKTLLFLALSIAFFSCNKKQNTANSDLQKLNLNGSIKSVLEETFMLSEDLQKGEKTMDNGFDNLKLFDKNGFILRKNLFTPEKTSAGTYIYEYDKNLLVKETKYTATENIDRVYVYSYNSDNQLDTQTAYTALGNVEYTDKFTYPSPTLSVQKSAGADGNLLYKWEYEYDANKNMIKKTWFAFGNIVFNTFIYNDKKQLIDQTEINEYGAITRWQYEYDAHGNATSESTTYPDGTQNICIFKYEYDKQNNWIVKQIFGNDIPLYRIERTIEYN